MNNYDAWKIILEITHSPKLKRIALRHIAQIEKRLLTAHQQSA